MQQRIRPSKQKMLYIFVVIAIGSLGTKSVPRSRDTYVIKNISHISKQEIMRAAIELLSYFRKPSNGSTVYVDICRRKKMHIYFSSRLNNIMCLVFRASQNICA